MLQRTATAARSEGKLIYAALNVNKLIYTTADVNKYVILTNVSLKSEFRIHARQPFVLLSVRDPKAKEASSRLHHARGGVVCGSQQ